MTRQAYNGIAVAAGKARTAVNRMTHGIRVLPDFIIVGAQKAGTTSLYSYLSTHPEVLRAFKKEVNYFDFNFELGLRWYRSHFPTRAYVRFRRLRSGGLALTGEASPFYLFHPHAAQRVKSVVPDVKLIVMLRNPIDRAFSHYQHQVRKGREGRPFDEAAFKEAENVQVDLDRTKRDPSYLGNAMANYSYLARGLYADQLETWLKCFARRQIFIINSEEFFARPQSGYNSVLEFLGLAPHVLRYVAAKNAGSYSREIDKKVKERLVEYFRPHNHRLFDLIGEQYNWGS